MILWQHLKKKIGKLNMNIKKKRVDILVYSSFFIAVLTTMKLNIYYGFYLLSFLLLVLAIIIAKFGS